MVLAYNEGAPWNNTNAKPTGNPEFKSFKDDQGAITTVGIKIISAWNGGGAIICNGATTGNNTGIYPDKVMRSGYYSITCRANL